MVSCWLSEGNGGKHPCIASRSKMSSSLVSYQFLRMLSFASDGEARGYCMAYRVYKVISTLTKPWLTELLTEPPP